MIYFLEVQGMTPITKHNYILIRMQITPKCLVMHRVTQVGAQSQMFQACVG